MKNTYTLTLLLATILGSCISSKSNSNKTTDTSSYISGEKTYQANCLVCHRLDQKTIGPPLGCIENRRNQKWIYSFVKNADKMIELGDTAAINIYKEYNNTSHIKYEQFNDSDISSLLHYLREKCDK